ncbi:MAG TPA: GNAT family N-acetyltransferase [Niastella sp.]
MNTTMPLYTPLDPDNKYAIVFEQTFTRKPVTMSLRPVSLPGDWPHIGKWLFKEYAPRARGSSPAGQLPEKHLLETFSIMLQCDFAQPFIGLLNDVPGFLIEICDGDRHCDGLLAGPHVFERGDHVIRLVLSPTVINTRYWSTYALISSLGYFFSHLQVNRIVWELHAKDKHYINLANQLGFKTNNEHDWPGIHVYLYSREKFTQFSNAWQQQIQKLP